jgi:hypothetical protein
MEYKNELKHWGIKGMKWGVRRFQKKDGSLTPAGKKRYDDVHEDYLNAHDGKSVKQLSTKELKARNDRLQQEQNYERLTQKTNKGKKVVQTFISTAGTLTAAIAAYGTYKTLANNGIDKLGDWVVKGIDLSRPFD